MLHWFGRDLPAPSHGETTMHELAGLTRLATEIAALEAETFEIADYAETKELYFMSDSCACVSTCSTTSCCSTSG